MTRRLVLTPFARADIIEVLQWSVEQFGEAIRDGYEELIDAVLNDIRANPSLAGSHERSELGPGVRVVHLRVSRDCVPEGARRILAPVHVVFYRVVGDTVHVSRLLHEARNYAAQPLP